MRIYFISLFISGQKKKKDSNSLYNYRGGFQQTKPAMHKAMSEYRFTVLQTLEFF